jgi:hypothetical protein
LGSNNIFFSLVVVVEFFLAFFFVGFVFWVVFWVWVAFVGLLVVVVEVASSKNNSTTLFLNAFFNAS